MQPKYFMQGENNHCFYGALNPQLTSYLENLLEKVHAAYDTEGNLEKLMISGFRCEAANGDEKYANMTFSLFFEGTEQPFVIDTWVVAEASFPTADFDETRYDISIGGVIDLDLADTIDVHYFLLWLLDHYQLSQFTSLPSGITYHRG